MENALYGIYALADFVSEILIVRCAHSVYFWYVNNTWVNTVRAHFVWSILYNPNAIDSEELITPVARWNCSNCNREKRAKNRKLKLMKQRLCWQSAMFYDKIWLTMWAHCANTKTPGSVWNKYLVRVHEKVRRAIASLPGAKTGVTSPFSFILHPLLSLCTLPKSGIISPSTVIT